MLRNLKIAPDIRKTKIVLEELEDEDQDQEICPWIPMHPFQMMQTLQRTIFHEDGYQISNYDWDLSLLFSQVWWENILQNISIKLIPASTCKYDIQMHELIVKSLNST